jgi:cell division protein FtsA
VRLDSLAAGVHLTGGGSMLPGIDELAREVFGIPTHVARAKGIIWAASALESPRYSCAIGLLKLGAIRRETPGDTRRRYFYVLPTRAA